MNIGVLDNFHDFEPVQEDFLSAVIAGLTAPIKTIPSKFFYDEKGSDLFDQICRLDEYYPTRTELALLKRHGLEIADTIGAVYFLGDEFDSFLDGHVKFIEELEFRFFFTGSNYCFCKLNCSVAALFPMS